MDKAESAFLKVLEINPRFINTLNNLGVLYIELNDFEKAEKFYLAGLSIKPDHNGINEYLGELYVQTNQIDKAKERLDVLKDCNCDEFKELELIIKTRGTKVY